MVLKAITMKLLKAMVIITMCIVAVFPLYISAIDCGDRIPDHVFGNGQPSVTIGFTGAGMDDSASLSLQTGLSIYSASLKVSSLPPLSGQDYPTNASVDIGGDGVPEWEFRGTNIGQLGKQTLFKTGQSQAIDGFPDH